MKTECPRLERYRPIGTKYSVALWSNPPWCRQCSRPLSSDTGLSLASSFWFTPFILLLSYNACTNANGSSNRQPLIPLCSASTHLALDYHCFTAARRDRLNREYTVSREGTVSPAPCLHIHVRLRPLHTWTHNAALGLDFICNETTWKIDFFTYTIQFIFH